MLLISGHSWFKPALLEIDLPVVAPQVEAAGKAGPPKGAGAAQLEPPAKGTCLAPTKDVG